MCLQNKKLISASKSGDVMTVVSLLNSGADIQTEDEVYIHLFSHLSSFLHRGAFFTLASIFMFICAICRVQ